MTKTANRDLCLRTEDIADSEILDFYQGAATELQIIEKLKGREPVLLRGARGTGKSFLMKVAERQLLDGLGKGQSGRVRMPVSLNFASAVIDLDPATSAHDFKTWVINKIANKVYRSAKRAGLIRESLDFSGTGSAEDLMYFIEDITEQGMVHEFVLFIDEAVHVFSPERQAIFFTIMRSLRSANLTINAAVYPGVTNFGSQFEPFQDAEVIDLAKDISSPEYVEWCRRLLQDQAPDYLKRWEKRSGADYVPLLAIAASGNPRSLLRLASESGNPHSVLSQDNVRMLSNHTALGDKFSGREELVNWSRQFLQEDLLKWFGVRNQNASHGGASEFRAYLFISNKVPAALKFAVDMLCYSNLLILHDINYQTRQSPGNRYLVNCCLLLEGLSRNEDRLKFADAMSTGEVPVKRFREVHPNSKSLNDLPELSLDAEQVDRYDIEQFMKEPVQKLPLTDFQKKALQSIGIATVRSAYDADEHQLKKAKGIGEKRASTIRQSIKAAVFEFIT